MVEPHNAVGDAVADEIAGDVGIEMRGGFDFHSTDTQWGMANLRARVLRPAQCSSFSLLPLFLVHASESFSILLSFFSLLASTCLEVPWRSSQCAKVDRLARLSPAFCELGFGTVVAKLSCFPTQTSNKGQILRSAPTDSCPMTLQKVVGLS